MRHHDWNRPLCVAMLMGAIALSACDDPSGPEGNPAVNPALLEAAGGVGGAVGGADGLPQGAAEMSGPGGLLMDATAEEFIQQLTTLSGDVWTTSGIQVMAVPDESVDDPVIDRMSFVAAVTGSLESVGTGAYGVMPRSDWPQINFMDRAPLNAAAISYPDDMATHYADEGVFEITSIEYFDDVYTCELDVDSADIDVCEYQLGLLQGTIRFEVTTETGTVVQQETEFALPIRRRTLVGRLRNI